MHALLIEARKFEADPEHFAIQITYAIDCMWNGIDHCTVQIECNASCGWRIDTFGKEAEALCRLAAAAQKILSNTTLGSSKYEVLLTQLPNVVINS